MKRVIRYAAVVLAMLTGAVLLGLGRRQARAQAEHRQQLAEDNLTLPSQSQHLMRLADTLSRAQRDTLFRRYDLSRLFQTFPKSEQNGFFGPHEQRMEVVFTRLRRDSSAPGLFHVVGLMRVASTISLLKGTIELRQTRKFSAAADGVYIATGPFHLQQFTGNEQLLARLDGVMALDFAVGHGKFHLFSEEGAIRPRTRQFAFEGKWTDARSGKKQRVLWANEFAPVANAVLGDFDIGGRMATVNPTYRHYGWAEYFENDEWWANSPKPKLSL